MGVEGSWLGSSDQGPKRKREHIQRRMHRKHGRHSRKGKQDRRKSLLRRGVRSPRGPWSELLWCRKGGDTSNELRGIDSEKVATLNVGFTAENLVVCMWGDRPAIDQGIGRR